MSEQRKLKPGDALYHRDYRHGEFVQNSALGNPVGNFFGRLRPLSEDNRGTFWDLADEHGEHNVGRVVVVTQQDELLAPCTCHAVEWDGDVGGYQLSAMLGTRSGARGWAKVDCDWDYWRWATPQEQAKYYEERGGRETKGTAPDTVRPDPHPLKVGDPVRVVNRESVWYGHAGEIVALTSGGYPMLRLWRDKPLRFFEQELERIAPALPHSAREQTKADPSFGQLVSDEQLRQAAKKEAKAPLVPDQPETNPHANCKGCNGKKGLHGAYLACEQAESLPAAGDKLGRSLDIVQTRRRALANLLKEKAEQGLGPYPDDAVLADARSVLWEEAVP